jgi:hypothetical protein
MLSNFAIAIPPVDECEPRKKQNCMDSVRHPASHLEPDGLPIFVIGPDFR